jgi:hypothetical protein
VLLPPRSLSLSLSLRGFIPLSPPPPPPPRRPFADLNASPSSLKYPSLFSLNLFSSSPFFLSKSLFRLLLPPSSLESDDWNLALEFERRWPPGRLVGSTRIGFGLGGGPPSSLRERRDGFGALRRWRPSSSESGPESSSESSYRRRRPGRSPAPGGGGGPLPYEAMLLR